LYIVDLYIFLFLQNWEDGRKTNYGDIYTIWMSLDHV